MSKTRGLTASEEAFAAGVAQGLTLAEAHRRAYPKSARWSLAALYVKASAVASRDHVRVRIAELRAAASEIAVLRAADVMRVTANIINVSPGRLVRREKVGEQERLTMLMPDELDPETAAAVQSFEYDLELGKIKYRFADKNVAADRAAKLLGMYERDNEQRGRGFADLLALLSGNVLQPDPSAALPLPGDEGVEADDD